jgi:hypothetical protein
VTSPGVPDWLGGLPPRRPDQSYTPAPPSIASGAGAVFKGRLVVISGTSSNGSVGLFVYSGAPANGNLIASIASTSGTDQFNNAYQAGITSYDPGVTNNIVNLFAGIISLSRSTLSQNPATISFANASMSIIGASNLAAFANEIILAGGASGGTVTRIQGSDGSNAYLKTCEPNNFGASTAWHQLSGFAAGFSVGGECRYRLTIENELEVHFRNLVHDGVTADPDGTIVLSSANGIPAAFRPPSARRFSVYCNQIRVIATGPPTTSSGAALEIETDGSIQCFGFAQAATRIDGYACLPLD